jgi:hypothetical protein
VKSFNDLVPSNDAFEAPKLKQSVPSQPTANLDQINTWLYACIQTHKSCSSRSSRLAASSQRPTRLLELTSDGVRLRCDTSAIEDLQYLTLSHVWGDTPHRLRLTLSRLDEFQSAIPWSELPAIFIEALRIVRHTNFRFLWIDVLCIIQDSPSDWETEAASMTSVYSNSACSIAFLFPPGEDLIQTREDPRAMSPCIIRKATETSEGIYIVASGTRRLPDSTDVGQYTHESRLDYHEWPISQRAWTFQEHLLSPRTVFYGHQTIMWECMEEFCDELAGSWLPKAETRFFNHGPRTYNRKITQKSHLSSSHTPRSCDSSRSSADYKSALDYIQNWKDLVLEYRARSITVPSDRPMAFAGVARAFQNETKMTYLAGVWAEFPTEVLLWTVDPEPFVRCKDGCKLPWSHEIREPGSKMAPSWSWLSCPLYSDCQFRFCDKISDLSANPHHGNSFISSVKLAHFQWSGWPLNQVPPTAFYEFSGLRITLNVARFEETRIEKNKDDEFECLCLKDKLESLCDFESPKTRLYWDDIGCKEPSPKKVCIALLVEGWRSRVRGHFCAGLALVPAEEKGTWKRSGYWQATMHLPAGKGHDEEQIIEETYITRREWKPSDPSVFLQLEGVKMETLTLV